MEHPTGGPADVYLGLRDIFLKGTSEALGIKPSPELRHVWGMLVEVGLETGTATLVMIADGTTSLYLSNGGGTIGAGEAQDVADATRRCLAAAEAGLEPFGSVDSFPLPARGRVSFVVLTHVDGPRRAEAAETELSAAAHPLTPVWRAASEVLTQVQRLEAAIPNQAGS